MNDLISNACKAVSEARLMEDTRALAAWEKHAGTKGELAAFDYLKARMDAAGFETRLISHDAYISLPGLARLRVAGREPRCITHSFSRPSPGGGLQAEVVYCGKGSAEELAAAGVRGRIALIEGLASPWATKLANDAGALGQIHVTPDGKIHEMCVSPVWGNPAPSDMDSLPRAVILTIGREDGEALKAAVAAGTVSATMEAEVDTGWRPTPILTAELFPRGTGADSPFVMFSGHVDSWYFGVMDNGTANATMLEVARQVSACKDHMRRGLRLCFWSGHSQGRYSSSAWYADHHFDELDARCLAHVNIDSPGGIGAEDLTGAGSDLPLRGVAAEAVAACSGQTITGRKIGRAGDESFWGVGIPALFGAISHQRTGIDAQVLPLGWWWHTPEDTLDKIAPDLLVRDTQVFVHGVLRLLTEETIPLDYARTAHSLAAALDSLVVPGSAADAAVLADLARRVAQAVERSVGGATAAVRDDRLRALSRVLVPLECSEGDRFSHDPALPLAHWPALNALRALARTDAGSDARRHAEVAAVRAANRIRHTLRSALAILGMPALDTGKERK